MRRLRSPTSTTLLCFSSSPLRITLPAISSWRSQYFRVRPGRNRTRFNSPRGRARQLVMVGLSHIHVPCSQTFQYSRTLSHKRCEIGERGGATLSSIFWSQVDLLAAPTRPSRLSRRLPRLLSQCSIAQHITPKRSSFTAARTDAQLRGQTVGSLCCSVCGPWFCAAILGQSVLARLPDYCSAGITIQPALMVETIMVRGARWSLDPCPTPPIPCSLHAHANPKQTGLCRAAAAAAAVVERRRYPPLPSCPLHSSPLLPTPPHSSPLRPGRKKAFAAAAEKVNGPEKLAEQQSRSAAPSNSLFTRCHDAGTLPLTTYLLCTPYSLGSTAIEGCTPCFDQRV